mmetsp:Transcript_97829/g.193692  ORF Transcript_97829/g.193692 Transcript_97829/m.193692 type:complete len:129 (-) Transcript_97829:325-711(-)
MHRISLVTSYHRTLSHLAKEPRTLQTRTLDVFGTCILHDKKSPLKHLLHVLGGHMQQQHALNGANPACVHPTMCYEAAASLHGILVRIGLGIAHCGARSRGSVGGLLSSVDVKLCFASTGHELLPGQH